MVDVIAALTSRDLWYVSRGSGLVLLVVVSLDVALGIALRRGARPPGLPRFATAFLHRDLSLLAAALGALHVATAVLDPYAGIGWLASVVPLASPYRPVWIGLGALSLDVGAAMLVTSLFRHRLGARAWRVVHLLVYVSWPFAILHSLRSGIDLSLGFVSAVTWACVALVALAVAWRIAGAPARPAPASRLRGGSGHLPAGPNTPGPPAGRADVGAGRTR